MGFDEIISVIGKGVDAAGVGLIVVGLTIFTVRFLMKLREGAGDAYQHYRHGVGRALLLGLEFLVAADIIRTVAIDPNFRNVGVLALIVLIRTFLSWSLELELEGHWPWQSPRRARSSDRTSDKPQPSSAD
ncbi:MAG: DUF1622 domain-containing protein [Chloroflexaceae bacterium]